MKLKLMIIGLFVLGFTFTSQAQTRAKAPQVVKTERPVKKMKHGVNPRKLTKKQAIKRKQQRLRIAKINRRSRAATTFTPKGEFNLKARQKRANAVMKMKKARQ